MTGATGRFLERAKTGLGTIYQTITGSLNSSTLQFRATQITGPWLGFFWDFTGTVDLNGNAVGQSTGPYDTTLTVTGASGPAHGQWITAQTTGVAKKAMAKLCNGKPVFGDDDD